ncbi:ABC transporter ATP-binding protein [Cucumibacter marinus]|uniref:ABC transporter ATP-binding protein n=1 Tax=Cucumibacter marinus TaxID=1121252 RepID=UPI0003F503B5|nr:ABC transporter ATP-binding protein [Cucumibacter marinus]
MTQKTPGLHPAIEFVGASKHYGDLKVVDDLSFSIAQGEFVALLGPSGCGKSTLLKLISGIEDPTGGEIYVDGKLVNYTLPRDRNVAMVFQNYALYPHMSVAENIAYPLKTGLKRSVPAKDIAKRVKSVAAVVDIADQLEKRPEHLSGGQRQRVALARAIIREPAVFLMDEPLSNLDALLRDDMRHQLISLHRKVGRATVYVTHDQLEAITMADRIVVLNKGRIQQVGTPADVFQKPANTFVANFVGSPSMTMLSGQVVARDGRVITGDGVEFTTAPMPDVEIGQPVTIGLRPTDVGIAEGGKGEGELAGLIETIEYTGPDYLCSVRLDQRTIVRARLNALRSPEVGDEATVRIAPEHVHIFDEHGRRVN